ncbi:MAG: hypothetical protein HY581_02740 [Nitrospirae bacterium]|nr:hypothetical protein [Nitrospirota bacterium]
MIRLPITGALLVINLALPAQGIPAETAEEMPAWRGWLKEQGFSGHVRFDYYSASKRLDNNHSLPGLTFQPKLLPKFGSWGDAKMEWRFTDQDLGDRREIKWARLLEGYANFYFGPIDVRIGKQNIPWGRADALNPTDNLTPKDFTLLSAKDEEERRIGTAALKATYYRGTYTLSLIWLPIFNPITIPLGPPPGFQLTEDKRSQGKWSDQGFAIKLDQTGGEIDWSVSYYYGLDVFPVGRPLSANHTVLVHNRLHVFGADFARTLGRFGVRGEAAYIHTQDPKGTDPVIKNPYVYYVLGVDHDLTEDLNINLQAYQRLIVNWHDQFEIKDQVLRDAAVLNVTFNQQLDRVQEGLTGRIKATWWNKTLEGELLGVWNANRSDFFVRPSLAYAFTDVWKGFIGWDIFNGRRQSFYGFFQPMTAFFMEIRATF